MISSGIVRAGAFSASRVGDGAPTYDSVYVGRPSVADISNCALFAKSLKKGGVIAALLLSASLAHAFEANSLCTQLNVDAMPLECDEQGVWQELAKAREGQAPIPVSSLSLSVGGDAAARVEELWRTGFVPPGRDVEPWPFQLPADWNADPFEDRNWRFHVQAWRMIDPMIAASERTGDDAYFRGALDVMLDWYDYHYGENAAESDFQWYDMSVGLRAMKLAWVLDRLLTGEQTAGPEVLRALTHLGALHAQSLTDIGQLSQGNHGLFQLHGLKALCSVLPELNHCARYESYARHHMQDLVRRQFSAEGIHLEHSPAYHFFAFNVIQQFLRSGWYDDYPDLQTRMQKARENRAWMVHPDGTTVTVGDSRPTRARLEFPAGAPECREDFSGKPGCYLLQVFPESGYAMVRSDWAVPVDAASMIFFMAAFHSHHHRLPDDLSFEWFEQGGRVLSNSGVYSYNKDPWRDYVESTRAHNTVEIDDRSFPVARQYAYGSALGETEEVEGVFRLSGRVHHGSLGAVHERAMLYSPARWLAVVDTIDMEWPATYTQWFHFAPDIEVEASGELHKAVRSDGVELLIESNAPGTSLVRGQEEPVIQGWVTRSYGEMEPRYSLGMNYSGFGGEMITLFALSREDLDAARSAVTGLRGKESIPSPPSRGRGR